MLTIVLFVLALICFIIAMFRIGKTLWIDLITLGLVFLTLGWLLPLVGVHA